LQKTSVVALLYAIHGSTDLIRSAEYLGGDPFSIVSLSVAGCTSKQLAAISSRCAAAAEQRHGEFIFSFGAALLTNLSTPPPGLFLFLLQSFILAVIFELFQYIH